MAQGLLFSDANSAKFNGVTPNGGAKCIWSRLKLALLVGRQEGHPVCKNEWWVAGMLICLGEVQICIWPSWYHCHSLSLASVTSFLIPAHPGNPRQNPESHKTVVCFDKQLTINLKWYRIDEYFQLKLNRKSNCDIAGDLGCLLTPKHLNFYILHCLLYLHSDWT